MKRVFLIADTHFGHKNILLYEKEKRPFATIGEHDESLIERWNSVVKPDDTVWHLGDVLFGQQSFAILPRLHGLKNLVMGNHDQYPIRWYAKHFRGIYGAAELHDCILTHVPIHPQQFYRFRGNIHGHTHSHSIGDPRYACVSVEQTQLMPVLFDEVIDGLPSVISKPGDMA
ncbi:MAG: metallophosphoesterase family protein [Burkholderiaceae bacterium]